MAQSLFQWLIKNAKGWLILILLGLFFLFNMVIMPFGQAWLGGSVDEVGSIDLTFAASPQLLFDKVAAYGEQGRAVYRLFALTADVVYPIIYALFFGLAITYFFQRVFPSESRLQYFNLVPFGALIFDVAENLGIVGLLSTYPNQFTWLAVLTVMINVIKWLLAGGSVVLLFIGIAAAIVSKLSKKSDSTKVDQ